MSRTNLNNLKVGDPIGVVDYSSYGRGMRYVRKGEVVEVKTKVVKCQFHTDAENRPVTGKPVSFNINDGFEYGRGARFSGGGARLVLDMDELDKLMAAYRQQRAEETKQRKDRKAQMYEDTGMSAIKCDANRAAIESVAEYVNDCIRKTDDDIRRSGSRTNSKPATKAQALNQKMYEYEYALQYRDNAIEFGCTKRAIEIMQSLVDSAVRWELGDQEYRAKATDAEIDRHLRVDDWAKYALKDHAKNLLQQVFSYRPSIRNSSFQTESEMGEHKANVDISKLLQQHVFGSKLFY